MKRYQVKIEDAVSSQSFSLDELLELGLLDDYDVNIKVRATDESTWHVALEYPFHISEAAVSNDDFTINEDGTVTRKKKKTITPTSSANTVSNRQGYSIDEYGQIVRPNTSGSSLSTSESTTETTLSSTYDDNRGCLWGIAIMIGIGIFATIFG